MIVFIITKMINYRLEIKSTCLPANSHVPDKQMMQRPVNHVIVERGSDVLQWSFPLPNTYLELRNNYRFHPEIWLGCGCVRAHVCGVSVHVLLASVWVLLEFSGFPLDQEHVGLWICDAKWPSGKNACVAYSHLTTSIPGIDERNNQHNWRILNRHQNEYTHHKAFFGFASWKGL